MSTLITSSIRDIQIARTPDPVAQVVTVDIPRTNRGDIASVVGANRLIQRVNDWLMTPVGGYFADPTYGNQLLGQVLQPPATDPSAYAGMVRTGEADFLRRQAVAAAQGYLDLAAQVDHFGSIDVVFGDNGINGPVGTVTVTTHVYARSGVALPAVSTYYNN